MCLAVPGELLSVSADEPLFRRGRVAFGAVTKEVSLACVPEARPGQFLLVHAGIAIAVIDADEAGRVFDLLARIDGGSAV